MSNQHWEYFIFDGLKSDDYGVWISGADTFGAPERDVEVVEIPGRNGTLTLDNGRWKNMQITYPCFMSGDFLEGFDAFKSALLAKKGYLTLADTYHPDGFRKARLVGGIKAKTGPYNRSAAFTLTFDCWPQFFLNSGQSQIDIDTSPQTLVIPDSVILPVKPLIRVGASSPYSGKKSGVLTMTSTAGSTSITLTDIQCKGALDAAGNYFIDCERETIYRSSEATSLMENATIPDGFFEITERTVSFSSTGDLFFWSVTPRWWTL